MSEKGDRLLKAEIASLQAQVSALRVTCEDLQERVEFLENSDRATSQFEVVSSVAPPVPPVRTIDLRSSGTSLVEIDDVEWRAGVRLQGRLVLSLGERAEARSEGLQAGIGCGWQVVSTSWQRATVVRLTTPLFLLESFQKSGGCASEVQIVEVQWEAREVVEHSGLVVPASLTDV